MKSPWNSRVVLVRISERQFLTYPLMLLMWPTLYLLIPLLRISPRDEKTYIYSKSLIFTQTSVQTGKQMASHVHTKTGKRSIVHMLEVRSPCGEQAGLSCSSEMSWDSQEKPPWVVTVGRGRDLSESFLCVRAGTYLLWISCWCHSRESSGFLSHLLRWGRDTRETARVLKDVRGFLLSGHGLVLLQSLHLHTRVA